MKPAAKGWCPGSHRPMASGDGLVLRLRPALGRMTAADVLRVCTVAGACGNGMLELTSRANLQLRGLSPASHPEALAALDGLIDADPALESRRNILVAPLWQAGDVTQRIATDLAASLARLPDLPAKFGFAIDAGPSPVLAGASADIRLEHGRTGLLVPPAEATALAYALQQLLQNPAQAQRLGQAARQQALTACGREHMWRRYRALLDAPGGRN